jgi:hypothetical protein
MTHYDLFQVTGIKCGKAFCAGVIFKSLEYHKAAPILKGPASGSGYFSKFKALCDRRDWKLVHIKSW